MDVEFAIKYLIWVVVFIIALAGLYAALKKLGVM